MITESEEGARVEDVFKAAPGNQKVLITAMEACREPRTPRELDAIMDEVLRCNRSVYRPVELRALLERFGALVYEPSDEERAARAALDAGEECEPVVDEDGNLVIGARVEGVWTLSEAGAAYLDGDPVGSFAQGLFVKDAVYLRVSSAARVLGRGPRRGRNRRASRYAPPRAAAALVFGVLPRRA
ncbi:hypothetical protein [Eggerthella sinensis]|uniref:hypothetical protein n=1 Tax=Eggerthella sinensis TaxID=242230 RepID=UPI0022E23C53|nr:hypothetical protein [Eggerthella sinensis]